MATDWRFGARRCNLGLGLLVVYVVSDARPKCGCTDWPDDECLYPASVQRNAELEAQIRQAKELLTAFILAQSWAGSAECKAAEIWLERT